MGGLTPMPVRARCAFSRRTSRHADDHRQLPGPETDLGTPPSPAPPVTVTVDGRPGGGARRHVVLRGGRGGVWTHPEAVRDRQLAAFGSCRMCLVEIDGPPAYPPPARPCADGMVVSTQTETVRTLRRNVMELYLSDHPEDCDGCARHCEIQDIATTVGSAPRSATAGPSLP